MRVYVCDCLRQTDQSQIPYERVDLLNDGIEVQCLGHSIKVIKVPKILRVPHDFLPLGATYARMDWWAQNGELFDLSQIINIENIRHVQVMWDVDEQLAFNTFLLFLPNIGEPPMPIPHPATIEPIQEPMAEGTARDVPEVGEDDEPQDLDEIDETGTEDL
jgi:hypothetical protein